MALRPDPRAVVIVAVALIVAAVGGAIFSSTQIHSGATATRTTTLERTQADLLVLVNEARAEHHLHPLALDMTLESLAAIHTVHMIRGGYFAHDEPRGYSFARRAAQLHRREVRENLAWGTGSYATPSGTLALWLASPEHRLTLLNPAMRRIGIAVLRGGPYQGQSAAIVTTADLSS